MLSLTRKAMLGVALALAACLGTGCGQDESRGQAAHGVYAPETPPPQYVLAGAAPQGQHVWLIASIPVATGKLHLFPTQPPAPPSADSIWVNDHWTHIDDAWRWQADRSH